jgi:serine/threonine protein kinase
VRVIGRYALYDEIASGGMATVHLGRLMGPVGFARTVAIKRLHPQFAKDQSFASMFVDEARLVARIRHPNVVQTLDVVASEQELFLVMDYVHGASLASLLRACVAQGQTVPPQIAASIVAGVLHGLHAAHVATNERDEPLGIVHRDVSPHNVLVGVDGIARVLDFGVAKAAGRIQTTAEGQLKGKIPYMAPEQITVAAEVASDVYAASVVLWEALATRRLFSGENEVLVISKVLAGAKEPPSKHAGKLPAGLDAITMRGLAVDPARRFVNAREMARALENCVQFATASDIGEWVERLVGSELATRTMRIKQMESRSFTVGERAPVPEGASPTTVSEGAPARMLAGTDLGEATQLSSGSVSASRTRPPARRLSVGVAAGIAGAAVTGALAMLVFLGRGPRQPATGGADPAGPLVAPSVTDSSVGEDPQPPGSSETYEKPADTPDASVAPSGVLPKSFHGGKVRRNCNPPYVDDPQTGKRKWKPACL